MKSIVFPRTKRELLKKRIWKSYTGTIREVRKVEAKLHRINLSGQYGYSSLKNRLGSLADLTNSTKKWNYSYDRKYQKRYKNFRLIIFVNPKKNFLPPCFINVTPTKDISLSSHKKFLEKLNRVLPGLKVSSAEYTIDVFCDCPTVINLLFYVTNKTLYIPFQKSISFFGNQSINYGGKKTYYNVGVHIGENKYYERGKDFHKQKIKRSIKRRKKHRGWKIEKIDRLRFEFTSNRKKLISYGMGDLHVFLKNPKFFEINQEKWQFREFKSKKHPCPWERKTFQEKFIKLKKKLKDVSQAMTKSQSLQSLKYKMDFAIQDFDMNWSGNYIIENKELIEIPY